MKIEVISPCIKKCLFTSFMVENTGKLGYTLQSNGFIEKCIIIIKKITLYPQITGILRQKVLQAHLYHYAGNNPVRYTDPTGAFDWNTNTIESGDTLSQIAQDCNTRYGTNYSAADFTGIKFGHNK